MFTFRAILAVALGFTGLHAKAQLSAWGMQGRFGTDAVGAWKKMHKKCSDSNVVVAIVDTGIDATHPALKGSLWQNPSEVRGKTGVDDDRNGFPDDVNGWDFVTNRPILIDTHGHGTHIAGIISANEAGPNGFKGVCPGLKIMSLRYYNEKGSGAANLRNTVAAIDYAVKNGADIINYSGGGPERSELEYQALKRAEAKGILVVAAAGNEQSDADKRLYFPAAYNLENILAVTAIDPNGHILPSSNWGKIRVHVAAPGHEILSTLPKKEFGTLTGTSQATAFVTGIAGMLLSQRPSLNFRDLKMIIENSTIPTAELSDKEKMGGKMGGYVSATSALDMLKSGNFKRIPLRSTAVARENPATSSTLQIYRVNQ